MILCSSVVTAYELVRSHRVLVGLSVLYRLEILMLCRVGVGAEWDVESQKHYAIAVTNPPPLVG
jgi:hypothetical protein